MKNTLFYRFLVVFFVSLHQLTNGLIRDVKTLNWKIERILRKFHTSGWSQSQSQQVFCRFSVCLFFCKSIFLSLSALSSLVFIHRGSTLATACFRSGRFWEEVKAIISLLESLPGRTKVSKDFFETKMTGF